METSTHDVAIKLSSAKKETDEVSRMALATGSEEDEIEEMIRIDKILVAKKNGKTIGFIALRDIRKDHNMEITGLAVKENEKRKGHANLLLKHAEEFAYSHKAQKLIVRTSNDNLPALTLYQKNGFIISEVKLGVMVDHHGGREIPGWKRIPVRNEIVLEKKLSPTNHKSSFYT